MSSHKKSKKRDRKNRKLLKKIRRLEKKVKRNGRSRSRSRSNRSRSVSYSSASSRSSWSRSSNSSVGSRNKSRSRDRSVYKSKSRSRSPRLGPRYHQRRSRSDSGEKSHSPYVERHSRSTSQHEKTHILKNKERDPRGTSTVDKNPNLKDKERDPRGASNVDKSLNRKNEEREPIGTSSLEKDKICTTDKKDSDSNEQQKFDEEYIDLLSDDGLMDMADGKPINETIAEKLSKIARLGLPKDITDNIFKKRPLPENCQSLRAPILNSQIANLLTAGKKKDKYQVQNQNQLGMAVGILGSALSTLMSMKKSEETASAFEAVMDGARLIADLHHNISVTRRIFAMPVLDFVAKNVAKESPIDNFLFGADFSEKLNKAKEVEKASRQIKKPQPVEKREKSSTTSGSNKNTGNFQKEAKNWQGPSRRGYSKYESYSSPRKQGGAKSYNRNEKRQFQRK